MVQPIIRKGDVAKEHVAVPVDDGNAAQGAGSFMEGCSKAGSRGRVQAAAHSKDSSMFLDPSRIVLPLPATVLG